MDYRFSWLLWLTHQREPRDAAFDPGPTVQCPECLAWTIETADRRCPHCDADLSRLMARARSAWRWRRWLFFVSLAGATTIGIYYILTHF